MIIRRSIAKTHVVGPKTALSKPFSPIFRQFLLQEASKKLGSRPFFKVTIRLLEPGERTSRACICAPLQVFCRRASRRLASLSPEIMRKQGEKRRKTLLLEAFRRPITRGKSGVDLPMRIAERLAKLRLEDATASAARSRS